MTTVELVASLPGPAEGARCDADAGERAVARVYTKTAHLDLCGHHLRDNWALIQANGFEFGVSERVQVTPYEIDPDFVRLTPA